MKVKVKKTFMMHKHEEKDTITLQTGSVYNAEKIISATGNIFYILSVADLILDANDFHKYFSIVREIPLQTAKQKKNSKLQMTC